MNYKEGKIYKIQNDLNDFIYVGSTIQSLEKRFSAHKSDLDRNIHKPLYALMSEIGVERFSISLIEKYPCSNKTELNCREGFYIREYGDKSLNKNIAGRTNKQYMNDNIDRTRERRRNFYLNNKARILEDIKQHHITCECGSTIRKQEIARHNKSKQHLNYLAINKDG